MKCDKKQIIGLVAMLLVAAIAVGGIVLWLRDSKLEQIQNEALAELERNVGQYDEKSIVLYETSKAKAEELAKLYGATLRITENGRFATLTLPEGTTIRDVYAMEESRKYIDEMAADYQVHTSELTEEEGSGERLPIHPNYTVSDTDYELQTYLDYLNMGMVWNSYTGSGVTVAVIDTGIDTDHPEFAGRISEYSYNATEDKIVKDYDDWSLIEDEVGHGTAVTGVIAATMNSGNVVGIAPDVEIIVIKAECSESGQFKRVSDLVFGLYYAVERDVNVVNMSFGTYAPTNPFAAAVQLAVDSDIICVAAAGNDDTATICWPAADENVIGVGALDGWELADYSNFGENVSLCAPGTTYTSLMDGKYGNMTGTSLASPIVAGAMALLLQNHRYVTVDEATEILYASCYDLGDLGRDWYYGFGALDISALVLEERGTIKYDMLTDELENQEGIFIQGHTLQELPEPERLYAVFDGWYYDDTFTQEYNYYEDKFYGEVTLYAKWVNEDDGIPYTYVILDNGTVEIRSYTGHRRFITIPEKIEGRVVSSIGDFAFANQTRLRELTLPSGLTHIGLYAFQNCANLVSIHIPENVTKIEEYAFSGNVRLSTVAFLGNSKLTTIGDFAFTDCGSLERIELPAALESINGSAFSGASALYDIGVHQGNIRYKSVNGVLFNLSGSTLVAFPAAWGSSYTLPENTTNIGAYAFACAKLQTIDLANVSIIGDYAFVRTQLEMLEIPDCVTDIGKYAFGMNENLSVLTIGKGLTVIPDAAFCQASSLKTIIIPDNILSIGAEAFACSALESVVFGENSTLTNIGGNAFERCGILEVDIPATVLEIGKGAFKENPLTRVGFAPESVLHTIGAEAFANCGSLKAISLPANLRTIDDLAFQATGLTAVTVPTSVTRMGGGAFSLCADLTSVAVEDGNTAYHDLDGVVYTLDNITIHTYPAGRAGESYTLETTTQIVAPWAFAGAVNLTGVELPDGLCEIWEYGFACCSKLQTIQIPDNVVEIARFSFAQNWSLRRVYFGQAAKLSRIGNAAFAYCGLTRFTVPANVSTIAQNAFEGSSSLTWIIFEENSKLESISAYMFSGCENLQSITFNPGSALTSIQAHGLEGMDELTSIDFGDAKLTNIDNFAFRFCERLSELNLPDTVTNIGRYAFYACENLSRLTIPESVEHIGSYAFLGTKDMELYFNAEMLPLYLDENWDYGTKGYYTGVSSIEENSDFRYAVLPSGNVAILEYLGADTAIDLTQLNLGGNITIIGGSAFECSTLQSVVLPDTLTAIQAEAFAYSALESITIPANVTFIGREAFAYTDITTLTFAENAKIAVIEQYAFEGTKELTAVTLPASLTKLGTGVFLESGLQSVVFKHGIQLTEIPLKAFAETKLTSVALPDSVTLVNHNAFNNVQTLESVTFGNNEGIRLMSNAFYHTGLESLHIPANVTYIGEYCFVALSNLSEFTVDENNPKYKAEDGLLLTKSGRKLIAVPAGRTGSLTVPKSVEEIGFGAFEESKLSEILFHDDANILTFGYRAFFKANNITTITVPKSVVSIDYYAFAYCENLKEVIFLEGNQLKGIYEGAFCGDISLENITIPDSIVEVSDFAFYGCSRLTQLPISENNQIKGIYDYAFAYTGLNGEFTTPESLIDIGNYAFLGTKLESVTIPDTNKKDLIIGIGAFQDCNSLTEITLPFIGASYEDEQITWFGYIFGAGSYWANETYIPESMKTVTITEGLTTIYDGGFFSCTGLETIHIPHSVSVIYNQAFRFTTAKHEFTNTITTYRWERSEQKLYAQVNQHFGPGLSGHLTISDDVTSLEMYAFNNCYNLESITIPASVTSVDYGAFDNCRIQKVYFEDFSAWLAMKVEGVSNPYHSGADVYVNGVLLEELILPEGMDEIHATALAGCTSLKLLVVPTGVTTIGANAFNRCENLESITLPEGLTTIEECAFMDCTRLREISLPSTLTTMADNAFAWCESLYMVTNRSDLNLTMDAPSGYKFGYYTDVMIDKHGNTIYRDDSYVEIGDGFLFTYTNGTYQLRAYMGEENTVTFPADVNGCPYEIYLFRGPDHVILPEGMTHIPSQAFSGHLTMKSITIPDSVTSIGSHAFYGCAGLTSIDIPSGVTYIGVGAFAQCAGLTSLAIPSGVTVIEHSLCNGCENLTSISLPENITSIGSSAFHACYALDRLEIPTGVTDIGGFAFYDCHGLDSLEIPSSVTSIGAMAFPKGITLNFVGNNASFKSQNGIVYNLEMTQIVYVDVGIAGHVVLPESITQIPDNAFSACTELTGITIPAGVTEIPYNAFSGCTKLTGITIPDGVTSIGSSAFYGCTSLRTVTIPDSVTDIESGAFQDCTSLESVKLSSKLTTIASNLFQECRSLESIEIPEGVTVIDHDAFWRCEALQTVVIPNTVTEIGAGAFGKCVSLENIELPDSLVTIGGSIFMGCEKLKSIHIPHGVTSIPDRAFFISGITSVTIPGSVTSIGVSAFDNCLNLTGVTIPDGVTSIAENAFHWCLSLQCVELPQSITSIGEGAFSDCTMLSEVINRSDLELSLGSTEHGGIAANAAVLVDRNGNKTYRENLFETEDHFLFSYVDGVYTLLRYLGEEETVTLPLTVNGSSYQPQSFGGANHVIIPEGFTEIGRYAFNHSDLQSVTIPGSVKYMGFGAFMDCANLKHVYIAEGLEHIDGCAFRGCINLETVNIPESVTKIDWQMFLYCWELYANPQHYQDGVLMIDDWIFDVDENVEYLPERVLRSARGVASEALISCYLLKTSIWGNDAVPSNVEMLFITDLNNSLAYVDTGTNLVLKNIVICDTVDSADLEDQPWRFSSLNGVTFFVEALEEDLRWDENFPGWSNGNKVVYGDEWHWANFYDENGNLLYSQPCRNTEIIRLPVHEISADERYTYEIIGWDLDGDGEADNIAATSVRDIHARPVVVAHERLYSIQFADQDQTVYHSVQLPYGATITAPADPTKQGHDFAGWSGLAEGMTVTGDIVIYASWKHHGNGHEYAAPVWVDATCTQPGHYRHSCTICGYSYMTGQTQPLGHSYEPTMIAATCTEPGYVLHTCTVCGDSYQDAFTDLASHSYGEWVEDQAPACALEGAQHRDCSACGYREEGSIPAKGHTLVETQRIEATCAAAGEQIYSCADCGMIVRDSLPVVAHAFEKQLADQSFLEQLFALLPDILWGYEGDQVYYYVCSECRHIMNLDEWQEGGAGVASAACRHRQAVWTVVHPASCLENGVEGYTCTNCEKVLAVKLLAATGHSHIAVTTAPTCTEDGYTVYTCHCGDSYVTDHTDALGHDFVDGVCSRCGVLDVILGDVNGDGRINVRDARAILRYIAGLVGEDELNVNAADFNGDGRVNVRDARAILNYIAGLS